MKLYDYQADAIRKMHNGCILCGGVGSGKSVTSIAYYFLLCGGKIFEDHMVDMTDIVDLYIITTAMKRDKKEWEIDLGYFGMSPDPNLNTQKCKIVVDSWNNIKSMSVWKGHSLYLMSKES